MARKKPKLRDDNSDEVMEVVREVENVQHINAGNIQVDGEDSDDTQMGDVSKPRKATLTVTASATNGKPTAKGKGKGKGPPPKSKETLPDPAAIDVDAVDKLDVSDDELNEVLRGTSRTSATDLGPGKKEKASREVMKLQERLRLVRGLPILNPMTVVYLHLSSHKNMCGRSRRNWRRRNVYEKQRRKEC